jgi:peptidoglycan hydrolase-like protein with peptidoglycan-binding domain
LSKGRRIRIAAAATLAVAGGAVVAIAALGSPGSPAASRADVGVPAGDGTAMVQRRTLTEHTQASGTLGYGGSQDLYDRVAGTFTWLPGVGAVIGRGGTLWRIDNEPVVLMYGAVPAYRTLKAGVADGPDVGELNANLAALGFDPTGTIASSQHFSEATAAAVRRWQAAEGLPETGSVQLGRVVFATSARRVTAVHVVLGQDPPGGSEPSTPAPIKPAAKKPAASKRPHRHKHHPSSSGGGQPGKGSSEPKKEPASNSEEKPSAGNPGASKEGAGGGAPQLALSTTSTQQVVELQVKASQQELAHVGEAAPVTLPDGTTVEGRITSVGTVASEGSGENERGGAGGSGNGENATIAVTVTLHRHVPRLDKAPVSVELVKEVRRNVLTVPATALVAVAGGGYAIRALENGRRVLLTVTPGMFAGGYVQVEGAGVREGLTVLEPQ